MAKRTDNENGQRSHSTPQQRALAVARVMAGESRRKVARENAVNEATVRRWVRLAERRETPQDQKLAADAAEIADDIEERLVVARDKLLARLVEVIPRARGVQSVAISFGVISDKLALVRGEPTSRDEHVTQADFDREVKELVSKVKRNANGARSRSPA